jgi:hypothetical protein
MVEQLAFAHKQVKFVEWHAQEWEKCYEMSMVDYKKSAKNSTIQYVALTMEGHIFKIKVLKFKLDLEGSKKDITNFQYHKTICLCKIRGLQSVKMARKIFIYLFIIFIEMMCIFYL